MSSFFIFITSAIARSAFAWSPPARGVEYPRDDEVFARLLVHRFSATDRFTLVAYGSTMIIQCTPSLSATMPKHGEKKVFDSGIVT